jgi:hypothetical protein
MTEETTEEVEGVFHSKNPAQIMMLGIVTSDGRKMPPFFFKPGEKIGADCYKVLR